MLTQNELDDFRTYLSQEKGLVIPTLSVTYSAHERSYVFVTARDMSYKIFYTREEFCNWMETLPSAEEAISLEFKKLMAKAIEFGRENGFEINPLIAMMKTLSSNILAISRSQT